jgi:hypothetical protein
MAPRPSEADVSMTHDVPLSPQDKKISLRKLREEQILASADGLAHHVSFCIDSCSRVVLEKTFFENLESFQSAIKSVNFYSLYESLEQAGHNSQALTGMTFWLINKN